jgi:CRP/FNR family transcriptional regulator, nitrogen fixation regulation protein
MAADVWRREESVIIRNSSSVRVSEPIWTHQRDAAPKSALSGLDSFAVRAHYARGQEVYRELDPVECWYRIESGVARRFSTRVDGKRQIVDLLLPGDVFGFGARGKHHFVVEAVTEDTVVARYPRSRLETLAERDPRIAQELREAACEAMSRLHAVILNLGRTTAEQKVGHFLAKIAERLPRSATNSLTLPISREDIADYLALSVETVSRALTQLKRSGMIRLTGTRQIILLDREALIGTGEEHFAISDEPRATEHHHVRPRSIPVTVETQSANSDSRFENNNTTSSRRIG